VHLQVDGEYAGQLPARVSVVEDALTLLVPGAYGRN
jgi:diacylglycerol kinase family enzyme